ncbi:MAG: amidohydrolase family protein, partial [Ignavibacteria bacterium]
HEIDESLQQHGTRPLERLQRLGLVDPRLIAVHAVHLTPDEIAVLAASGASVAHCPTSNMKLASGIAPVAAMLKQSLRVGLGTDGAASNNRLDLFREMRHAALLAKAASGDATVASAHEVLRMATLDGASALGLDSEIGSLLPGKSADLCAVRLSDWLIQPCFDPASHLVYAAGREDVTHVWVAGELRVCDATPTRVDPRELLDITRIWHNILCV